MANFAQKITLSLVLLGLVLFTSCGEDDEPQVAPMGVAFESTALGIDDSGEVTATISFTRAAVVAGTIEITATENGVVYGTDYVTDPAVSSGTLSLTIAEGDTEASFTITRETEFISSGNSVSFEISSVTGEEDALISGNTSVEVSFEAIASTGGELEADMGGASESHQVYVDLSLKSMTRVERTSWDLGFYSGSDNRVILNYSTYMVASATEKTSMGDVSSADTVGLSNVLRVGTFGSNAFIDDPAGDLNATAIAEISSNDDDNVVYIVNLGSGPGEGNVDPGLSDVASVARGWKKVRILLSGNDYVVQYADLDAETFSEATISKNDLYNFVYFSFETNEEVMVEPTKEKWDLNLTVSTYVIPGYGAYGYSDFVTLNGTAGVESIQIATKEDDGEGNLIETGAIAYDDLTLSDVSAMELSGANDVIGGNWRSVFTGVAYDYRYYIIKDTEDNYYKVQFQELTNNEGVRGYPSFKYELLK